MKRSDFLLYNVNGVRKFFNASFLRQYLLEKNICKTVYSMVSDFVLISLSKHWILIIKTKIVLLSIHKSPQQTLLNEFFHTSIWPTIVWKGYADSQAYWE